MRPRCQLVRLVFYKNGKSIIKNKFEIESTKDLEQDEFSDFLDRIIRYFAEQGFPVEDPRRPTTLP